MGVDHNRSADRRDFEIMPARSSPFRDPKKPLLVALAVLAVVVSTATEAASGCGSRGGPGYRGPNGRCVGWDQLGRVCGTPPTTRCTSEAVAVGAPEHADGQEKLRSELRIKRETDRQPAIRYLTRP